MTDDDHEPDEPEPDGPACLECMDSGEVIVGDILMPCPCCPAYDDHLAAEKAGQARLERLRGK